MLIKLSHNGQSNGIPVIISFPAHLSISTERPSSMAMMAVFQHSRGFCLAVAVAVADPGCFSCLSV